MDTSPPTTFRIMDLPAEIFKLHFKEEIDDRFYATFFAEIEASLAQNKLQSLLWLSQRSRLVRHIKSLLFSIDDDHTARPQYGLVNRIINNIGFFNSSFTLGVASQQWNHPAFWDHCREMTDFLTFCLVPLRDVINVDTWKIVVRTHDIRLANWNLQDCFSEIGDFICGVVSGDVTLTQAINLEIHDGAGDPVRHVQVTSNGTRHRLRNARQLQQNLLTGRCVLYRSLEAQDPHHQRFRLLARNRNFAEDFRPRFQDIWVRMAEIRTLEFVQVRFSKKNETTQAPRFMKIMQQGQNIHLSMQNLGLWHWDIMGKFTVFSEIHSLNIQNCAIDTCEYHELFYGPKLQHVVLHHVAQYSVSRSFDPPTVNVNRDSWEYYLVMMAGCAPLQSLWVSHLDDEHGQIVYTRPWIVKGTPERSVKQAIYTQYP